MIKIADVIISNRGTKRIKFLKTGIYDLLKNHLSFRYIKINKTGYYLKCNKNGRFEVVNFTKLSESFREYISNNFESITELKSISIRDFMNEYYSQIPIKDNNECRKYLGEDFELTSENLHYVLMKIDYRYRESYKANEILKFLRQENFIETIDNVGNFAPKKPMFYKRFSANEFWVFNQPFINKKGNDCSFDFWIVRVDTEKRFLNERLHKSEYIDSKLGFDLERDIKLYEGRNQAVK